MLRLLDALNLEIHHGFGAVPANSRVVDPCHVPVDLLVSRQELEGAKHHNEYNLCKPQNIP